MNQLMTRGICFFCSSSLYGLINDEIQGSCHDCGHYKITSEIYVILTEGSEEKALIGGFLRHRNSKQELVIDIQEFQSILDSVSKYRDVGTKLIHTLEIIHRLQRGPGHNIRFNEEDKYLYYARDAQELRFLIDELTNANLLKYRDPDSPDPYLRGFHITYEGIKALKEVNPSSKQVFIAMVLGKFDIEPKHIFDNINKEFKKISGGFYFVRMGSGSHKIHDEKICDRLISEIRKSRFMIADLTYFNPNVMYEAGYAQGLGLKVIFTCEKNYFEENHKEKSPFDTRQYSVILWEKDKPDELRQSIIYFIGANF